MTPKDRDNVEEYWHMSKVFKMCRRRKAATMPIEKDGKMFDKYSNTTMVDGDGDEFGGILGTNDEKIARKIGFYC